MASSRHQSLRWVYAPEIENQDEGAFVILNPAKFKHLRTVLRLAISDEILAFDGKGRSFLATLESGGAAPGVRLGALVKNDAQLSKLELIIGLPKNKTMDWIVEKAVECGVTTIRPVITSRTVVIPAKDELGKYTRRWEAIAAEALEQSQQLWMPTILEPQPWVSLFSAEQKQASESGSFVFSSESREEGSLSESLDLMQSAPQKSYRLFIGPEGGFSADERRQLGAVGYKELSLGRSILRVETAVIAALTLGRICRRD